MAELQSDADALREIVAQCRRHFGLVTLSATSAILEIADRVEAMQRAIEAASDPNIRTLLSEAPAGDKATAAVESLWRALEDCIAGGSGLAYP